PWTVPGSGQCGECHAAAPRGFLGLRADQLHGADRSTLRAWDAAGLFANPDDIDYGVIRPLSASEGSVDDRARGYLDVNCATCHRPGGTTQSDLDLRVATPLAATRACDVP